MRTDGPRTALEAAAWRRLPLSGWPWRAAGYLLTTPPVALPAAAALGVPWLLLLTRPMAGGHGFAAPVALVLLGAALIVLLGPVIAVPLAGLERRRLRLVDARPLTPARRPPAAGGPAARLRALYGAPATWREVGYVCLLATAGPVLSTAALLAVPLVGGFVAAPLMVAAQRPGDAPVALGFGEAATVEQALPYTAAGLVLLPALPYLLALLAGGHAAVARALLGESGDRLRAELVEVARSRARLVDAFEAERRRIERDLHDGAQQRLIALTLRLGLARHDLPPGSPAAGAVAAAHEEAKRLTAELRELIHGIQPQILTELGLPAALDELADRSPVPVAVDAPITGRLPVQVENTAYFVVAEALANVARHSGATGATVTARPHRRMLAVEVRDDGRGGADPARGTGLTGLADRVVAIDGRMLLSSPPGGPTVLRVELPCPVNRP
ncbi:sensor histidine kinase [Actinomadura sp. 21ATH]|uniref:sensor histidine kinase n=1 Tax=Actinomadura sp. 21ATH TaxID=1735444 RepID=UPI0035C146C2